MKSKTKSKTFISSDLSLVSAILATKKAELVHSEAATPFRYEFHLLPFEVCAQLEREYINDKLTISAKAIADNVRLLKSIIKGR